MAVRGTFIFISSCAQNCLVFSDISHLLINHCRSIPFKCLNRVSKFLIFDSYLSLVLSVSDNITVNTRMNSTSSVRKKILKLKKSKKKKVCRLLFLLMVILWFTLYCHALYHSRFLLGHLAFAGRPGITGFCFYYHVGEGVVSLPFVLS